jgi:hypothetical protein
VALVVPHAWTAGDDATSTFLQTLTDGVKQLQGGTPTGSGTVLDFALLRQTVTQTLTTATWTSITFTTEDADLAGGHSTATNTSRYVIANAGYVTLEFGVTFAGASVAGQRGVRLVKNGTAIPQGRLLVNPAASGSTELMGSKTVAVAVGDYLEVQGYQTSGGNLDTAYVSGEVGCYMNVRWVHS